MRFILIILSVPLFLALAVLSGPVVASEALTTPASTATFEVDPVHSTVLYKVMHNRASYFYGRFSEMTGSFEFDAEDPANCSMMVEIRSESVDTLSDKLNQHLRSPDFFDVKQFPVIAFRSTEVESNTEGVYQVTGELMLHGVTKTITIDVEQIGSSDWRGRKVMGFHTSFVIDRTEYGMGYGAGGPLGSDVELIISIEAGQI